NIRFDTLYVRDALPISTFAGFGAAVWVSLSANEAYTPGGANHLATLSNVENLVGTSNDDTLIGDGNANRLNGGNGNDMLIGGAGDGKSVCRNCSDSLNS